MKIKRRDWLLESFISGITQGDAEEEPTSYQVTLSMSGMVIMGEIISQPRFFEQMAELGNAHNHEHWMNLSHRAAEDEQKVRQERDSLVAALESLDRELTEDDRARLAQYDRTFIHLHFLGGAERIRTPLWRGRLPDVTGWVLGGVEPHQLA